MVFKKVALILSVSTSIIAGFAQAVDPAVSYLKFGGRIVAAGCKISTADSDLSISMGEVEATAGATPKGKLGEAKTFQIHLINCALEDKPEVSITFDGATDSKNSGLFALDPVAGAATGVGLELSLTGDSEKKMLPSQTVILSDLIGTTAKPGSNTLEFSAQYIATAESVTVGDANVEVSFTLDYP